MDSTGIHTTLHGYGFKVRVLQGLEIEANA